MKRERKTITLYLVFFSTNHSYEPDVWYPSCLSWPRYDLIVTGLTIGQGCTVERMAEQIGLSRKTAASVNITVNTFGFRAAWRWLTASQTWESFVVIVDLGFGGCRCRSMHVYKLDWYHGSPRQNAARLGDSWPRNHGWMESWVGYASGRRNNRGSPPGI